MYLQDNIYLDIQLDVWYIIMYNKYNNIVNVTLKKCVFGVV